jgi:superfamily II DNA/RNA helicase
MIDFNNPDLQSEATRDKTFADLQLMPIITLAYATIDYVKPTTVQFYSIPLGVSENSPNLIVQSKSGTGKTLAFVSIMLHRLINALLKER